MKVNQNDIKNLSQTDNYVDRIRHDILNQFANMNADVGHTLPQRWLNLKYLPSLNPKEKIAFETAIQSLIDEKLIERKNDSISITQKGVETIY